MLTMLLRVLTLVVACLSLAAARDGIWGAGRGLLELTTTCQGKTMKDAPGPTGVSKLYPSQPKCSQAYRYKGAFVRPEGSTPKFDLSCFKFECVDAGMGTRKLMMKPSGTDGCSWSNVLLFDEDNKCVGRYEAEKAATTFFNLQCGTNYKVYAKDGEINGQRLDEFLDLKIELKCPLQQGALPTKVPGFGDRNGIIDKCEWCMPDAVLNIPCNGVFGSDPRPHFNPTECHGQQMAQCLLAASFHADQCSCTPQPMQPGDVCVNAPTGEVCKGPRRCIVDAAQSGTTVICNPQRDDPGSEKSCGQRPPSHVCVKPPVCNGQGGCNSNIFNDIQCAPGDEKCILPTQCVEGTPTCPGPTYQTAGVPCTTELTGDCLEAPVCGGDDDAGKCLDNIIKNGFVCGGPDQDTTDCEGPRTCYTGQTGYGCPLRGPKLGSTATPVSCRASTGCCVPEAFCTGVGYDCPETALTGPKCATGIQLDNTNAVCDFFCKAGVCGPQCS